MKSPLLRIFWFLGIGIILQGCASRTISKKLNAEAQIGSIRFLDTYLIPNRISYKGTVVGGFSGIDYDAAQDIYYLISDDPSAISPARFYKAQIPLNADLKIDSFILRDMHMLLKEDGLPYPPLGTSKTLKPDAEAIRYRGDHHTLVWSSEGERLLLAKDTILVQPTLSFMDTTGKYLGEISLPESLRFYKKEQGLRKNAFFEGLSYSADYKYLYGSLEEPLYEDGPQAQYQYNGALTRIYQFDMQRKEAVAAYAYPLDAIPVKPLADNSWNVNGISEILWVNKNQLLSIERAWAVGSTHSYVKLYLVNLNEASNELHNPGFMQQKPRKVLTKKLIFDMNGLGNVYIDNIEGVTFGPKLANGNRSLILVADDNFSKDQQQRLYLLELLP